MPRRRDRTVNTFRPLPSSFALNEVQHEVVASYGRAFSAYVKRNLKSTCDLLLERLMKDVPVHGPISLFPGQRKKNPRKLFPHSSGLDLWKGNKGTSVSIEHCVPTVDLLGISFVRGRLWGTAKRDSSGGFCGCGGGGGGGSVSIGVNRHRGR